MNEIVCGKVENTTKAKLKQTQLNFPTIKKLPQCKRKIKNSTNEHVQSMQMYSSFQTNNDSLDCKLLQENNHSSFMKTTVIDLCNTSNETNVKTSSESLEFENEDMQISGIAIIDNLENNNVIDLCQDSSFELEDKTKITTKLIRKKCKVSKKTLKSKKSENIQFTPDCSQLPKTLCSDGNLNKESYHRKKRSGTIDSEKNECPAYKVVEGTNFAVDAFNFGLIRNVTTYFLSHFHTDHYVGLTKKFSMPIYASEITINLIRGFISPDENLLNILYLNETVEIEGIYVTAIDANHCPGAIMLIFQLPDGSAILHTGDFRWSRKMELNPYLNQINIDLIYLDTTHISDKHIISSQEESIKKAIKWVQEFRNLNEKKKILYVVCTDVIGKENFWLSIAEAFDLKVWSDGKRRKALSLIGNQKILNKLVPAANEADMHVVSHSEAGFRHIEKYFQKFSDSYDILLSIKPKGLDSVEPEFLGELNSVSVRYSEHSTHKELREFLRFLLPKRVISTVPSGKNILRCPKVPVSWHTKELYVPYKRQASILNYVKNKKIE